MTEGPPVPASPTSLCCVIEQDTFEPQHYNNVVYATSKGSDQPAHIRSLIRAFGSCFNILYKATGRTSFGVSKLKRRLHMLV